MYKPILLDTKIQSLFIWKEPTYFNEIQAKINIDWYLTWLPSSDGVARPSIPAFQAGDSGPNPGQSILVNLKQVNFLNVVS